MDDDVEDPRAKIHMLVYGTVCSVTCWVCAVEMWHEPDMTPLQKQLTAACYGPFCIICTALPHDAEGGAEVSAC